MHRGRPMGESFDHCPPGWIGQSRKRCAQFIHNHMVVDCWAMSSVDFAIAWRHECGCRCSEPQDPGAVNVETPREIIRTGHPAKWIIQKWPKVFQLLQLYEKRSSVTTT